MAAADAKAMGYIEPVKITPKFITVLRQCKDIFEVIRRPAQRAFEGQYTVNLIV